MTPQSRLIAGILLILVPTVEIGGANILSLLISDPSYSQNDLRQDPEGSRPHSGGRGEQGGEEERDQRGDLVAESSPE